MRFIPVLVLLVACGGAEVAPVATPETPAPEVAPVAATPGAAEHYGAPFTLAAATPAADLIADPAAKKDQTVRVDGKIADVCQKAGCWMVLSTDDGRTMRITIEDHSWALPKDSTGAVASVEGRVIEREVDADEAEHVAGEAAHPELAPKAGKAYEIAATGVDITRG